MQHHGFHLLGLPVPEPHGSSQPDRLCSISLHDAVIGIKFFSLTHRAPGEELAPRATGSLTEHSAAL
ncbi:unnamed protein product [Ciceribacter sp. T2.26MG-112.2]|nr:unnamed protein product [Ciceribacter naphthalenivorans]